MLIRKDLVPHGMMHEQTRKHQSGSDALGLRAVSRRWEVRWTWGIFFKHSLHFWIGVREEGEAIRKRQEATQSPVWENILDIWVLLPPFGMGVGFKNLKLGHLLGVLLPSFGLLKSNLDL